MIVYIDLKEPDLSESLQCGQDKAAALRPDS
jgi:hypothetical protein